MITLALSFLILLSSANGMCYSSMLHGFAPDVVLPSMLSSDIYCPPPHVFDHFLCMCVDQSVVKARIPTEGRTSLDLSLLSANNRPPPSSNPPFRLASSLRNGLPDMHVPPGESSHSWSSSASLTFPFRMSSKRPALVGGSRVVPALNPYGSFNVPAKSKLVDDSGDIKQQELLEKARWRQQLEREAAAVAAAKLATAVRVAASGSGIARQSALDLFMRNTLRRILYGY